MSERTYLVAIDAWNTTHDVSMVKDFIMDSPVITDWWNYIPYVFLLVSPLSADELSDALKPYTRDASLLVIEANSGSAQGLLPKTAWKWLDRRAQPPNAGQPMVGALQPAAMQEAGKH
jgi:hypothetical protein